MAHAYFRWGALALVVSLAGGCATSMPGARFPKPESHALPPPATSISGLAFDAARGGDGRSGFRMLSAGMDGLLARVELIDAASSTLDLQYYIFRGDESGLLIASALLRAAERGVRIRLILDDGESVAGDEKILALASQPGVEVQIFNPLRYRGHVRALRAADFVLEKGRVDYRMHNKLLIADNSVVLVGGRNIGDQYFQIDPKSQFGDDDVMAAGPVVAQLSAVFDEFWRSPRTVPAAAVDPKHAAPAALAGLRSAIGEQQRRLDAAESEFLKRLATGEPLKNFTADTTQVKWATFKMAYDSPDKKDVVKGWAPGNLIYDAFAAQARGVNAEMLVITPYLVPTRGEMALLAEQRARNARVRMLTNSLCSTPSLPAQAGYVHHRSELLERGVELHEIRSALGDTQGSGQGRAITRRGTYGLHAKIYVFDRRSVMVGSMNLDQRSRHLNTEIGVIIDSPELAAQTAARFEELTQLDNAYLVERQPVGASSVLTWRTREDGVERVFTREPAHAPWQRAAVGLLSLLPLDGEL